MSFNSTDPLVRDDFFSTFHGKSCVQSFFVQFPRYRIRNPKKD
ncbi:hypothetical protein PBCV1_a086aL [Paramecium bursaria Chlorella virus 1]|uniref:Uncharacterized protein n=1 Tax=Paramecium bursaria Chlorella virus 1 TaxID=10506 RepID=F8TTX3_PBCV1|nr:hypothetical protein PBCV1_a086aL [Paramecium bursaria Chlorella virus 1]AEI70034.1 hypothetical protein [Paramecium bursaria Chlorella virus 1]